MSAPEIIPVDGAGSSPAPKAVPAPLYRPPVAATPPLPSEGITVMNRDGSFYTSDLGPPQGEVYSDGDSTNRLIEMMLVSRLFKKPTRKKSQQPKIIVVQVPSNSVPIAQELQSPQALIGKK